MAGGRQPMAAERQTASPDNVAGASRSASNERRRPNPQWQESEGPTNPIHISSRAHTTGMNTRATKGIKIAGYWPTNGGSNTWPGHAKSAASRGRWCECAISRPPRSSYRPARGTCERAPWPRPWQTTHTRPRQKQIITRRKQITAQKITCGAGSRQMSTTSFQSDMATEAARHPGSPDD